MTDSCGEETERAQNVKKCYKADLSAPETPGSSLNHKGPLNYLSESSKCI